MKNPFQRILDEQPVNTIELKKDISNDLGIKINLVHRYYSGRVKKYDPVIIHYIANYLNNRFHEGRKKYSTDDFLPHSVREIHRPLPHIKM